MFSWFKRKRDRSGDQLESFLRKWFRPSSLALAITQSVRSHFEAVEKGLIQFPAYKREGLNVAGVWFDLRLETLRCLFKFGKADLMLLADQKRQLDLLSSFLDERPYLEIPQPRGEPVADTIQAMWQAYVYLSNAGAELADSETWADLLRGQSRSIIDNLVSQTTELRRAWEAFENAIGSKSKNRPPVPLTFLECFYEDITAKCKSIAFSAVFGPSHETGMKYAERVTEEVGGDVAGLRIAFDRLKSATDPDEFLNKPI